MCLNGSQWKPLDGRRTGSRKALFEELKYLHFVTKFCFQVLDCEIEIRIMQCLRRVCIREILYNVNCRAGHRNMCIGRVGRKHETAKLEKELWHSSMS